MNTKHTLAPFLFWLKKRDWGKWEHVMYVEDFRSGIKTYEILRRECNISGLTEYKRIYVKSCVHSLVSMLMGWWAKRQLNN